MLPQRLPILAVDADAKSRQAVIHALWKPTRLPPHVRLYKAKSSSIIRASENPTRF